MYRKSIQLTVLLLVLCNFANANKLKVWNSDKSASAWCSTDAVPKCTVTVGELVTDVSNVTDANIGKLGTAQLSEYEKVETFPVEWLESSKSIHIINFKTYAWKNGKRHVATEPAIIKNGKYSTR